MLQTTQHGYRMATSVDGVLTGMGADVAIIDDPLKDEEGAGVSKSARDEAFSWFSESLTTRFDKPAEARVVEWSCEPRLAGMIEAGGKVCRGRVVMA